MKKILLLSAGIYAGLITTSVANNNPHVTILPDTTISIDLSSNNILSPELKKSIEELEKSLKQTEQSLNSKELLEDLKQIQRSTEVSSEKLNELIDKLKETEKKVKDAELKSELQSSADDLQAMLDDFNYSAPDLEEDTLSQDSLVKHKSDTTEIKIGKTRIVIIGEPKIDKIYQEKSDKEDEEDSEDSERELRKEKERREKNSLKKVRYSYFNMDLGFNALLENNSFTLSAKNAPLLEMDRGKSGNFSLYLVSSKVSLYKNYINFIYRIGFDYNNYRFTNDTMKLAPKMNYVTGITDYDNSKPVKFTKNKLVSNYLTVPLMLQVQSNPTKKNGGFHLSGGVELGYLIGSHTKQILENGDTRKNYDDFNLQPFRYGWVGRVGYKGFSVYTKYYATTTFAKNEGPKLNTISFGIELIGF